MIRTKIKNHHILGIGMQIICMDGQYHKKYLQTVLSGLKKHLNLIGKTEKLVTNLYDKQKSIMHIQNFKKQLRH